MPTTPHRPRSISRRSLALQTPGTASGDLRASAANQNATASRSNCRFPSWLSGKWGFAVRCRSFRDPNAYVLLERYASRDALAAHRATPHFQEIVIDQLVPLLADRRIAEFVIPEETA